MRPVNLRRAEERRAWGARSGEGEEMSGRRVVLRRGRRVGWWVEGRSAGGRLFMKTWWPTQGLARAVARLVGGRAG
jgi:hypothetical protein